MHNFIHKKSTGYPQDTIMPVDKFMENHCPWKTCGQEEQLFDDVQIESDLADFEHETASNRAVYETSTDLCKNKPL